jgi:hypothetical protein
MFLVSSGLAFALVVTLFIELEYSAASAQHLFETSELLIEKSTSLVVEFFQTSVKRHTRFKERRHGLLLL